MSSALAAGCRFVVSEDMQAGMRVADMTVINPFETEPQAVLDPR